MKSKIIMLALAATVSLGACAAPHGSNTQNREYRHSETEDQQNNKYYRDNAGYYKHDNRDSRHESYVIRGEDLSREDVRKVQTSLAREGFYRGKIDGIWGRSTSQAILDYQTVRYPGRTGMTIHTLQEFGVRVDRDYNNRHYRQNHNNR
ncbi:MAG: peptidoglycan-binding domain-containing protein [Alphaproteobacteria bacterium]|nr:peptidoglycan-binding domain-containing protein [Alphaproteobacteria bacterium]